MAVYLQELENLRPSRFGYFRDLEQLADILNITIFNLKKKIWKLWRIGRWFIIFETTKKFARDNADAIWKEKTTICRNIKEVDNNGVRISSSRS